MVALIIFLALYITAGVLAIANNRPANLDRSWSVGAMLDGSSRRS